MLKLSIINFYYSSEFFNYFFDLIFSYYLYERLKLSVTSNGSSISQSIKTVKIKNDFNIDIQFTCLLGHCVDYVDYILYTGTPCRLRGLDSVYWDTL